MSRSRNVSAVMRKCRVYTWLMIASIAFTGCGGSHPTSRNANPSDGRIDAALDYYLDQHELSHADGRVVCKSRVLDIRSAGQGRVKAFGFAVCQDWVREASGLRLSAGEAIRFVAEVLRGRRIEIAGLEKPRDGILQAEDMRRLFPASVTKDLKDQLRKGLSCDLSRGSLQRARKVLHSERLPIIDATNCLVE